MMPVVRPANRPTFFEAIHPSVVRVRGRWAAGAALQAGVPDDRAVRNEWHAIAVAAAHVRLNRPDWSRIAAVEGLGVLGHRVWYETPPGEMALRGPRVLDVRPDGTVRILQGA